jgi:hypothetical protein
VTAIESTYLATQGQFKVKPCCQHIEMRISSGLAASFRSIDH